MTTDQIQKALDYKRQIIENVEHWLVSFQFTESVVSETLIHSFYNTVLAPFDSCGRFYNEQLPLMVGKPIKVFVDALRNLKVKVISPFDECVIYFPK